MDWVAKDFQPGFAELIFKHVGAGKEEKLLKALALMGVFSLLNLKSLAPSDNDEVSKLK